MKNFEDFLQKLTEISNEKIYEKYENEDEHFQNEMCLISIK